MTQVWIDNTRCRSARAFLNAPFLANLYDYLVDSACSINLTTFWSDFTDFQTPSRPSKVGGVGVTLKDSGTACVPICLVSCQTVFRLVHALYAHGLTSRSAHLGWHIGRLGVYSA
jgi:hypothetical protein